MKNETFFYSKNLILEIIKIHKIDFVENLEEAYSKYFINPSNPEDVEEAINKYIVNKNNIPNRNITIEEEYNLEFEKEKYIEFKSYFAPKVMTIKK